MYNNCAEIQRWGETVGCCLVQEVWRGIGPVEPVRMVFSDDESFLAIGSVENCQHDWMCYSYNTWKTLLSQWEDAKLHALPPLTLLLLKWNSITVIVPLQLHIVKEVNHDDKLSHLSQRRQFCVSLVISSRRSLVQRQHNSCSSTTHGWPHGFPLLDSCSVRKLLLSGLSMVISTGRVWKRNAISA